MILDDFSVTEQDGLTRFRCTVTDRDGARTLEFLRSGFPFIKADKRAVNWAAAALIMPAMLKGEDLEIRGTLSERFFHYLRDELQTCLTITSPKYKRIKVTCAGRTYEASPPSERVATGFSAGVDSFATFALHAPDAADATLRITDLAIFDVGALGPPDDAAVGDLFNLYTTRTKSFADRHGLGDFSITSNVAAFYDGIIFEDYYLFVILAAALTAEAHIDYYLLSSSETLANVGVHANENVSFMEPVVLPMLSTEGLSFITTGTSMARFEKTRLIADLKDAAELLDVCQNPAPKRIHQRKSNCSRCVKCMRTMTSLDLLGALDNFTEVFDVDFYRRHRTYVQYQVYKHAGRGSELDQEVVEIAANLGQPLPRAPYIPALFYMRRVREKAAERLTRA